MAQVERFGMRIESRLKTQAQKKARATDMKLAEVVRRFLQAWVRGNLRLPRG